MRTKIIQLTEQKTILEQYISNADNNWHDEVKQAFFFTHVDPIRQSFPPQKGAMEYMTSVMEQAEREINSLM